jgi:hypothetical protein
MKLPLQKGRFSTLKRLAVYIGSLNAATRQEHWTELGGVAALIDGSKGIAPLRITAEVSATQASHVRIRVPPTEAGKAGVWGLRLDGEEEGDVSVSRTSSQMVTLVGLVCGSSGAAHVPHLTRTLKLE